MGLQKIKVVAGMSLSVLLSLVAVFPAIAHHTPEHGKGQAISQMTDNQMTTTEQNITGRIKSIVGNVVTVELADGTTRDVMIGRADRERLALQPGMEIATMMRDGNLMVEVVNANASSESTSSEASTSTTTGRRVVEETTIRRSTTTAPVVEQSTEQTAGDVQQSTQEVEQNTDTTTTVEETSQPARPVRALW